jgi:hypothetical protein
MREAIYIEPDELAELRRRLGYYARRPRISLKITIG